MLFPPFFGVVVLPPLPFGVWCCFSPSLFLLWRRRTGGEVLLSSFLLGMVLLFQSFFWCTTALPSPSFLCVGRCCFSPSFFWRWCCVPARPPPSPPLTPSVGTGWKPRGHQEPRGTREGNRRVSSSPPNDRTLVESVQLEPCFAFRHLLSEATRFWPGADPVATRAALDVLGKNTGVSWLTRLADNLTEATWPVSRFVSCWVHLSRAPVTHSAFVARTSPTWTLSTRCCTDLRVSDICCAVANAPVKSFSKSHVSSCLMAALE